MFERLNERATKVMTLAHDEAARYRHPCVGTEHVLLGLIDEGEGVGANVLKGFGIDLAWIRPAVEKLSNPGPDSAVAGENLPQTPRVKKVIECAFEEARGLNHTYVGTEHLLLGLLRVREGVAATVLKQFGLSTEAVRQAVIDVVSLGVPPEPAPAAPPPVAAPSAYTLPGSRIAEAWLSFIVGAFLLWLRPNTPQLLLHYVRLAGEPLPMTDGTPYLHSTLFFPDTAVAAFALVLILGGVIFLLSPRRPYLIALAVLTAAVVLLNFVAVIVGWHSGLPIVCALAVAFGGYECIYLIGHLRS